MPVITGDTEFFKGVVSVKYEGPESDNPFAYRWYDESKTVAGKTMKNWLLECLLHSYRGVDPLGSHAYFQGCKDR